MIKLLRKLGYYTYSLFEIVIGFKNWPAVFSVFLRRHGSEPQIVRLRRPPVDYYVRSAMDVWSIKETYLDGFYIRIGEPVQDGWVVVDIGAGIGDFCIQAAYGNPNTIVYAFEPYAGSFNLLKRNLSKNGIGNVRVFQTAIWHEDGDLKLDLSAGEPLQFSSVEPGKNESALPFDTVSALSLASFIKHENISRIDLLKLDCEGAEYDIFLSVPSKVLSLIDRIVMEYHEIDDQKNHHHLAGFLSEQGYQVRIKKNAVHDELGYLYAFRI